MPVLQSSSSQFPPKVKPRRLTLNSSASILIQNLHNLFFFSKFKSIHAKKQKKQRWRRARVDDVIFQTSRVEQPSSLYFFRYRLHLPKVSSVKKGKSVKKVIKCSPSYHSTADNHIYYIHTFSECKWYEFFTRYFLIFYHPPHVSIMCT